MDEETGLFIYGTPLSSSEEGSAPAKKTIKRVDQEIVTDEKGRRRFHGAFTGGFSAGHFNTVGTPEGWTPSTFVSSRSAGRQSGAQQRPEDFMDEEDMDQAGIMPKGLRPTERFAVETDSQQSSSSTTDTLKILLKPIRQTIGTQILKHWGWRPGRGVGPQVQIPATAVGAGPKVYGCATGPSTSRDAVVQVNPEDEVGFEWTPKNDLFGLGYKSVMRREAITDRKVDAFRLSARGKGIRGQAFGVGAFEEEDEDVYTVDNLAGLDFVAGDEEQETPSPVYSTEFVPAQESEVPQYFAPPRVPREYKPRFLPPAPAFEPTQTAPLELKPLGTIRRERQKVKKEEVKPEPIAPSAQPRVSLAQFDGSKQERFEWYQRSQRLGISPKCPRDVTQTQWEAEMAEFASLIKPTSVKEQRADETSVATKLAMQMMSRFTTGGEDTVIVEKSEQKTTEETDKLKAVEMKMFGKMTRSSFDWYPDRILCRRMNVPEPYPGSTFTGIPGLKKPSAFKSMLDEVTSTPSVILKVKAREAKSRWDTGPKNSERESSEEGPSTLTPLEIEPKTEPSTATPSTSGHPAASMEPESAAPRPPLDFFRSIFTISDDEDETDELDPAETKNVAVTEKPVSTTVLEFESVSKPDFIGERSDAVSLEFTSDATVGAEQSPVGDRTASGTLQRSEQELELNGKQESKEKVENGSSEVKSNVDEMERDAEILAASYGPAIPPDLPDDDDDIEVITTVERHHRSSKKKHKKRSRSSRSPHSRSRHR